VWARSQALQLPSGARVHVAQMSDFGELPDLPKFAGKSDDQICSMLFAHLQKRLQDSVAERKALHASARDAHVLAESLMSEQEKLQRAHAELRRNHEKLGASFSFSQLENAELLRNNERLGILATALRGQLDDQQQVLEDMRHSHDQLIRQRQSLGEASDRERLELQEAHYEEQQQILTRQAVDTKLLQDTHRVETFAKDARIQELEMELHFVRGAAEPNLVRRAIGIIDQRESSGRNNRAFRAFT